MIQGQASPTLRGRQNTARGRNPRRPPTQYSCSCCAKVFKRKEHCIRHERTHTQEKPYSCSFCQKAYSRKDLVTRHERTLHAEASWAGAALSPSEQSPSNETSPREQLGDIEDGITLSMQQRSRGYSRHSMPATEAGRRNPNATTITATGPRRVTSTQLQEASLQKGPTPQEPVLRRSISVADTNMGMFGDIQDSLDLYSLDRSIPTGTKQVHIHNEHQQQRRRRLQRQRQRHDEDGEEEEEQQEQEPQPLTPGGDSGTSESQASQHAPRIQQQNIRSGTYIQLQPEYQATQDHLQLAAQPHYQDLEGSLQQTNSLAEIMLQTSQPGINTPMEFEFFSTIDNESLGMFMDHGIFDMSNPQRNHDSSLGPLLPSIPGANVPNQPMSMGDLGSSELSDALQDPQQPPDKASRTLPSISEEEHPSLSTLKADQSVLDFIYQDLSQFPPDPKISEELPSARILQGFVSTYIECFHVHLPIIHLPTLSLTSTPSPLILMICSIGALYRLNRRRARSLYDIAARYMERAPANMMAPSPTNAYGTLPASITLNVRSPENADSGSPVARYPLWAAQAKVLMSLYAVLSGDAELVSAAMHGNGSYTMLYGRIRAFLAENRANPADMTWSDWVIRESLKKLLAGIYFASTLSMVMYDVNPGFNQSHDLEIEIFQDDSLWNAPSAAQWRQLWSRPAMISGKTIKDVLTDVMTARMQQSRTQSYQVTPLVTLFVMYAVVVQMRQLSHVAESFVPFANMIPTAGQGSISNLLTQSAMDALDRCQEFLQTRPIGTFKSPQDERQTTVMSSCQAMLRAAYVRLMSKKTGFDRLSIINSDPVALEQSISNFARSKLERDPLTFRAVKVALNGFLLPVKLGHVVIRKTAAFHWSVEHAVSAWDCALFVSQWVHSIEIDAINDVTPSPEEDMLLAQVRDVLEEADCDIEEGMSLAAGLTSTWAMFFQDVWVWGITLRMGVALEQLAKAYKLVNETAQR